MDEVDRLIEMFRDRAASPVGSKLDALIKLERLSEPGIVPFLVQILADQRESEEVRIHVLKRLRNGGLSPEHRSLVAEAILHVLPTDGSAALRLQASMALAEFTDIDGVPATLGRLAFDWNESIDIRYSAFMSLQRTGPTTECIALLRQLSTDQMLGSSARGVLSSWHLEQLENLAPALVITAEVDVVRDEGEAYAHKLLAAGVPVTAVRYLGAIHDILLLNPIAHSLPTRAAIAQVAAAIRAAVER